MTVRVTAGQCTVRFQKTLSGHSLKPFANKGQQYPQLSFSAQASYDLFHSHALQHMAEEKFHRHM